MLLRIAMVALVSFGAFADTADTPLAVIDDPVYSHAQRRVEIEPGRHLNLYCTGTGSPTCSSLLGESHCVEHEGVDVRRLLHPLGHRLPGSVAGAQIDTNQDRFSL